MEKILIAMSGGVDSTVAALLLKRQGYDVAGVTLNLLPNNGNSDDIRDAAEAAASIGIPHFVFDMRSEFAEGVIDYFCAEYLRGCTPNPCVRCNKVIKFGALAEKAKELGYDKLATGHYARIGFENSRYFIRKATEPSKDQSYVLCELSQEVLSSIILPLGELSKAEIRAIAAEENLSVAHKRDSQDICFIPDGDYAGFLCNKTDYKPVCGDFLDIDGNIIGKHKGVIHYTVGQRKGLGITFGEPRYVTAKNAETNTVTLGKNEDLFVSRVEIREINLQKIDALTAPIRVTAKTRYSQKETPALLSPAECGAVLDFDELVRAPASGQSAVFFDGDALIGGGIII